MDIAGSASLSIRGYGISKDCIPVSMLDSIKKELTVQPTTNGMMTTGNQSQQVFRLYMESSKKLYVPKYYGLSKFGSPGTTKLPEGLDIDLKFTGILRDEQRQPIDAFLSACKDPSKMGGIISLSCGGGKCLARDTPLIMVNGDTKMVQYVQVGDMLMGDDSQSREVVSTCRGSEALYCIVPHSPLFDCYVVNESHILSL